MSRKDSKRLSRRKFLGIATAGATALSLSGLVTWFIRVFWPDVYYEPLKRVKIGSLEDFPPGTWKRFDTENFFVFSDEDGLYAISGVCQHLGCVVSRTKEGFQCPCHGSRYDKRGEVIGGPAPRGLPWFRIEQDVDGTLVVDLTKEVPRGTKYVFS